MRTLKTKIVLCGLLAAYPALAQEGEPKPEEVQLQPEAEAPATAPAAAEAAPAPAPEPPPAAAAPAAPVDTPAAAPPEATGQVEQGGASPSHAGPQSYGGPVTEEGDVWKFTYSGYFRAPMRIGIGARNRVGDQSGTTYHTPVIPDDQYLSWQQTRHNQRDWAELFFSVGNSWASGNVAIQGFQFTDAAWADETTQFGISQGWVQITPELPWENVRLSWKVGSFWGRYGAPGKYDAGEYDTFLFGRTHVMGETLRAEIDVNEYTFYAEHGIGTKRPDPNIFNRTRFTLLHHAHAGLVWDKTIDFGLHYMTSWTQEEERSFGPYFAPASTTYHPTQGAVAFRDPPETTPGSGGADPIPDGRLSVYGADVRMDLGSFGYLYAGFSRIDAKYAFTVAPAIEVLHSYGGGEYSLGVTDNYLETPGCRNAAVWTNPACSKGNGSVNTILAQYELSFGDLVAGVSDGGSPFGEGQDLTLKLYGMLNMVNSDNTVTNRAGTQVVNDYRKLKFGADAIFDLFPAFSVAARFDRLQPNNHIPEQSFSIISPRLIFRSQFVTREQIELQYSRYIYNERECDPMGDPLACAQPAASGTSPEGFGAAPGVTQDIDVRGAPTRRPDVDVIKLQASMWW
jgi:hypothetical protein